LMELLPLTDHLFVVPGERGGRFPRAHAFYVKDQACALIDTGCGIDRVRQLLDRFPVDLVINSHGHPDHSAGNWLMPDRPLYAPVQGIETHGQLEPLSSRFAEPGPLAHSWRAFVRSAMGFCDRRPTATFDDGHVFDFGHQRLRAIHAPGHTMDHYVLFDETRGVLLSFDLDLTRFGPWYGHRESSLPQLRAAIERLRDLDPRVVASSHRTPVYERDVVREVERFARVVEQREQRLMRLVGKGATLSDLTRARPIYGDHPYAPDLMTYWEGQMIEHHLADMITRGLVREPSPGRFEMTAG
jgi:glyoxylase-like metal-dependent hydrolase (beta-lactamase superfamily II)